MNTAAHRSKKRYIRRLFYTYIDCRITYCIFLSYKGYVLSFHYIISQKKHINEKVYLKQIQYFLYERRYIQYNKMKRTAP